MFLKEKFFLQDRATGNSYELGSTFSLGRSSTNNLVIHDNLISRVHCKITRQDKSYVIEDLKSKNGVLINQQLLKGRKTLQEGDILEIPPGKHVFFITARTSPAPWLYLLILLFVGGALFFPLKALFSRPGTGQEISSLNQPNSRNETLSLEQRIKTKLLNFGESEQYINEKTVARILVYMKQFHNSKKYDLCIKGQTQYQTIFDTTFKQYGIPGYFSFIPCIESDFNPKAYNRYSGARGMWQLMAPTAREMGLIVNNKVDQRTDPEKSTAAAARYIKELLAVFGYDAVLLTVASFNCGDNTIRYALKKISNPDKQRNFLYISSLGLLPRETEEYVFKFVALTVLQDLSLETKSDKQPK